MKKFEVQYAIENKGGFEVKLKNGAVIFFPDKKSLRDILNDKMKGLDEGAFTIIRAKWERGKFRHVKLEFEIKN